MSTMRQRTPTRNGPRIGRVYSSVFFASWGGLFFGARRGEGAPRNSRRKSSLDLNVRPENWPLWQW